MNSKLEHKELGLITIKKNSLAKRIIFRVKQGAIEMTVPTYATKSDLMKSIDNNKEKLAELINKHPEKKIFKNQTINSHTLNIELKTDRTKSVLYQKKGSNLEIIFPENTDFNNQSIYALVEKIIALFIKREAENYLPGRVQLLAEKINVKYKSISVTYGKKRLGKCDTKRNIALSYHLMFLPGHLIDYVIYHELAHLYEMNHGPSFHNLVNKFTDNKEKELEAELKRFVFPF